MARESQAFSFSELRQRAGLTMQETADITGYSLRTVYRWENNEIQPRKSVIDMLSKGIESRDVYPSSEEQQFTFIDLFAGIGGRRMAFERAGGKCLFACESDKYARQVYAANFHCDHAIAADLEAAAILRLPEHDLLVAGMPFKLTEAVAAVELIRRVLETHRPAAFLLENNRSTEPEQGALSALQRSLGQAGYYCDAARLDARTWVPQRRETAVVAGFRLDFGFRLADVLRPVRPRVPVLGDILHPEDGSEEPEPPYTIGAEARVAAKYTLSKPLWRYLQEQGAGNGRESAYGLVGPEDVAGTLTARYYKDGADILVRQGEGRPRRLTPRECARLMGFDGARRTPFVLPVSDTQAYKLFGAASVVPAIEAVAKQMAPYIAKVKSQQLELFGTEIG